MVANRKLGCNLQPSGNRECPLAAIKGNELNRTRRFRRSDMKNIDTSRPNPGCVLLT